MAQLVEVNGQVVEFPDGMPAGDIESAIKANYLSIPSAKAVAKPGIRGEGFDAAMGYTGADQTGGFLRGAGSIGATLARPFESNQSNDDRRANLDSSISQLTGSNADSLGYKTMKLGGEIAGTAGLGGGVANLLGRIPALVKYAAPLLESIGSAGMSAKGATGLNGVLTRSAGGAINGGLSAGAISPDDSGTGALIGGATSPILQLAGKFGSVVYNAVKSGKPGSGKLLADAMGVSESELPGIVAALKAAPAEVVPGSKLTVSQALQMQGQNTPGAKMLERTVSGGAGGDALLKRYADQGAARMAALEAQGAQTYQGAAKEEANFAGNKIGAMLRTQATDDQAAAKATWEKLYGRAADEGVSIQLPIDRMRSAMEPLGRGSVLPAKDARSVLGMADEIGYYTIPGVSQLPKQAASKSQSLEQAVRAAGGIRGKGGELRDLGIRESGTTGLVNNKSGKGADLLAEEMHRRGFIPDADPYTLIDAIRNKRGRNIFAHDAVENNNLQRMAESRMGDIPEAEKVLQAVPFAEFQRLRRDSGSLAAKLSERSGNETEAGVLTQFQKLLTGRVDDAAAGNLLQGENMSPGFRDAYQAAREQTKTNAGLYKSGNNITQILRKPGGNYALNGDEITNKIWHGGMGLGADVANLRNTLSFENNNQGMDALRKYIMTEAASKTTASGDLAAALPKYVESRMPGLMEVFDPYQMKALSDVASDIKNAAAAGNVKGLLGSDTEAKVSRALDAGLLGSDAAKTLGKVLSIKGIGLDTLRSKAAESVIKYKGNTIAQLMANPAEAAKALQDAGFMQSLDSSTLKALRVVVSRGAPLLATD